MRISELTGLINPGQDIKIEGIVRTKTDHEFVTYFLGKMELLMMKRFSDMYKNLEIDDLYSEGKLIILKARTTPRALANGPHLLREYSVITEDFLKKLFLDIKHENPREDIKLVEETDEYFAIEDFWTKWYVYCSKSNGKYRISRILTAYEKEQKEKGYHIN